MAKPMRDYFGEKSGDMWESFRDWMFDSGYDLGDAHNQEQADGYLDSWRNFTGPVHPDRNSLVDDDYFCPHYGFSDPSVED